MSSLLLGVLTERASGERRVALTPDSIARLQAAGIDVIVERGAGASAWFPDEQYEEAGAKTVELDDLLARADIVACVSEAGAPLDRLRRGQMVIGLLAPLLNPATMADLAAREITAVSLDGLPRTLSRAQGMDALTSQTSAAGYAAVLLAAQHFDRFFPLMITAAGTSKPASVLVLGAGVAGLQAIGTARRLGAVVTAFDLRPAARGEVASLGANFVEVESVELVAGDGGYARALSDDEQAALSAELSTVIARHDIVITTAQVPGRRPPLMVPAAAIAAMKAGSVVVDLAASALGGNVEGSRPGQTDVTANGVTVIGAPNLASALATGASTAYARNISAVLAHLVTDGTLTIDLDDEIQQGIVITHGGRVVQAATAGLLDPDLV
jgi:NAD(P) transhydrogenase subunit alpha